MNLKSKIEVECLCIKVAEEDQEVAAQIVPAEEIIDLFRAKKGHKLEDIKVERLMLRNMIK